MSKAKNKHHLHRVLRHIHYAQGHLKGVALFTPGIAQTQDSLEKAEKGTLDMMEANERTRDNGE